MYIDKIYTKLYSDRNWNGLNQLLSEIKLFARRDYEGLGWLDKLNQKVHRLWDAYKIKKSRRNGEDPDKVNEKLTEAKANSNIRRDKVQVNGILNKLENTLDYYENKNGMRDMYEHLWTRYNKSKPGSIKESIYRNLLKTEPERLGFYHDEDMLAHDIDDDIDPHRFKIEESAYHDNRIKKRWNELNNRLNKIRSKESERSWTNDPFNNEVNINGKYATELTDSMDPEGKKAGDQVDELIRMRRGSFRWSQVPKDIQEASNRYDRLHDKNFIDLLNGKIYHPYGDGFRPTAPYYN